LIGIDNVGAAAGVVLDAGEGDEGVVFADVETVVVLCSGEATLVFGVVFLVGLPREVLGFKEVDDVGLDGENDKY
jgi:hypothetical protein